jgi:beta-galactosidase
MIKKWKLIFCSWFMVLLFVVPVFANDSIFTPKPAAQSYINFDGKGFLINGQRTFIVSAGMEYARVPRALWADRLLKFKREGFNCVEVYTFWNYHEAANGQFDFSDNRDLDAFLKLAKSYGLYAIPRVGPYYCAEWDSGGYPVWLQFQSGLEVRKHNSAFEQYVTRFWDQLMPIVVNNQINRGGNVIMVQLENEHPSGWGTDGLSDPYFQFLQSKALSYGLEVPYFFSGLNHSGDPAGSPWSSSGRSSPWFSTEFWCDWYNVYGESASDITSKNRATWKIIAYGGNGYNYYMAHGGSNFDYYNNNEDASSYDYGAAVGETGDLRPLYYKFKRAAWFARSFQNILESSDNATSTYRSAASNTAVAVTARQSSSGTILFLDNSGSSTQQTKVNISGLSYPQTGNLTINPSEIVPVVTNFTLINGVTMKVAPTRILGTIQQGNTTTVVIYGQYGSPAELYFSVPSGTTITAGAGALSQDGSGNLTLKTTFPANNVNSYIFQTGSQKVRILAMSDSLADDTWFVDAGGNNYIISGPQYVGVANIDNGNLQINTETPWQNGTNNPVVAYGNDDNPFTLSALTTPGAHTTSLALGGWQTKSGIDPAASGYSTSGWFSSASGPPAMGADGDVSCYAWYRTTLNTPSTGTYTINLQSAKDRYIPYVDGVIVPAANIKNNSFTINVTAGNHTIAIFTAHYGRDKLYNFLGAFSQSNAKGITGSVIANSGIVAGPTNLTNWKVMMTNSSAVGTTPPAPSASGWNNYTLGQDAFRNQSGYAWFQTTLPAASNASKVTVDFSSVDDNCWVYINGIQILSHQGWNASFQADLSSHWNSSGSNVLTLLVQNTGGVGGVNPNATLTAYSGSNITLNNWLLQGGPGDPNATTGWQNLVNGTTYSGPQFYKTTFDANPTTGAGAYPIWRLVPTGLSHGSVWVNGHNLGRYPEMIPVSGVYIPECWLNSGQNILVIYDESGNRPDQVQIQAETAASRDIVAFESNGTPVNSYARLRNVATGLYIDGMGSTVDGSNACQWSDSDNDNRQWTIINSGSYVMIQNRATGLYLDGMGSSSNGAVCCQWSNSGSNNQQWTQETAGIYVRFKNRATGLYLDGMGSTGNGSNLCQWSNSGSTNQQWQIQ